jgi:hypothetical protein
MTMPAAHGTRRTSGLCALRTIAPAETAGAIRGFTWGTMTFRLEVENTEDEGERKFEAGEYAIEYLRRVSPKWRLFAAIEGSQLDEVELITEAQWHLHPRVFVKLNTGWGLTPNATDIAPEVGIMFSF